jgi:hypothetical protein
MDRRFMIIHWGNPTHYGGNAPYLLGAKGTKNRIYLPPYAYQTIPLYSPLK